MKKILFVTDLDGTLIDDGKMLSDRTAEIINKLISQGIYITYATARTINSSSKITSKINFNIPVINRNGTVLSNPITKEIINIEIFGEDELSTIKEYLKEYNIPGFVTSYIEGEETKSYMYNRLNEGMEKYLGNHENDKRLRKVYNEIDLYDGDVCYFTFISQKEELIHLYKCLGKSEKWNCIFQQDKYGSEYWLEICPINATKANAIKRLKDKYKCDKVVVFGDSLNDVSMFEIADESYAVKNAMEELKKISTGVIESNNADGVALFLESYINS